MFPAAIRPELQRCLTRIKISGPVLLMMSDSRLYAITDSDILQRDRLAVAHAARRVERAEQMAVQAQELVKQAEMALKNTKQMATALEMEQQRTNEEYLEKFNEFEFLHGPGHFTVRPYELR